MKPLEKKKTVIREYLSSIPSLPNEEGKKTRFMVLIGQLFGSKISGRLTEGMEKMVHIYSNAGKRRGFMDAYYGDLVIEFEKSLDSNLDEAERQLKEYISGLWQQKGKPDVYIAIATDGLQWEVYYPSLKDRAVHPWSRDDLELTKTEEFILNAENIINFYFLLDRLLLREGRLKPTVSAIKKDFGLDGFAFQDAIRLLNVAFDEVIEEPGPKLAFETWAKYLRYTYGSFEPNKDLFLKHTYLAGIARFFVWASFSLGRYQGSIDSVIRSVLNGEYFQAQRIENLVEEDFYRWILDPKVANSLITLWIKIINQMLTYDLSLIEQDILKGLYQQLVDENTRHGLGEYYTPDWLCERIVETLIPNSEFPRILDPACGSGSFLRAVLSHLLVNNEEVKAAEKLRRILDSVIGFDINPLAVIISKATYALTLRPLLRRARRPVHIPIYLADTLFLPKQVRQLIFKEKSVFEYELEFGGKVVRLPESLVLRPEYFDRAIDCCCEVAEDLSCKPGSETKRSLESFLRKQIPNITDHKEYREMIDGLWNFTEKLSELISDKANSIWAYIVKNNYRPTIFRKGFDFIIGNPPWLSYRYIEDPNYQKEVRELGLKVYKVAPKKEKLMTQMEIATIYLLHSIVQFGRDKNSKLAFVMPRSIFSSEQHEIFRIGTFGADASVYAYWDLRKVSPLFGVPACVAFLSKEKMSKSSYPVLEFSGKLPSQNLPWAEAKQYLAINEDRLKLIYLGRNSALSTLPGLRKPAPKGRYAREFYQGATIVPRNFYFVEIEGDSEKIDPEGIYKIKTDEEQAKGSKPPYKDIRLSGRVEGRFLGYALLAKHILPFRTLLPSRVVMPVKIYDNGFFIIRKAKDLRQSGYRFAADWFSNAETIWNQKRAEKADRKNIYQRLDYQKELTKQSAKRKHLVLYNAAGTHVAASYFNPQTLDSWTVVDAKVYWHFCFSAEEVFYLLAILNSSIPNQMIKPFQSLGLMGERDIHKKIITLPIPLFSKRDSLHMEISVLGKQAFEEAEIKLKSIPTFRNLGKTRSSLRDQLSGTINLIDQKVKLLLDLK